LKRAGADRVISPYQIGGMQMAQTALRPAVVDFVELATSSDNLDHNRGRIDSGEPVDSQRQPAAALRRHRGRHPAAADGEDRIQPGARHAHRAERQARCPGSPCVAQATRNRGGGVMPARVLDGTAVANQIRSELAPAVASFTARTGRPPGLGIVLVGDDPASEIYVRGKVKSAGETGLRADVERLPATA